MADDDNLPRPVEAFIEGIERTIWAHSNLDSDRRAEILREFADELAHEESRYDNLVEHVKHTLGTVDPDDDTLFVEQGLSDKGETQIRIQQHRLDAYEAGVYELQDDEGFRCQDCGWRGLTAPMADPSWDDEASKIVECPECTGQLDNLGDDTEAQLKRYAREEMDIDV